MAQLPLELGHRASYGGEDFLVAPCNQAAVAWLDRWPDWPGPGLAVHGPPGCGKTHLAHVFQAGAKARLLVPQDLERAAPLALLEGYVLTPRLVGDRVGLHPVWVIFALLAGGSLFGFVGLLLAVPAAAVIGVLTRFAVLRYRDSRYYPGDPWPNSPSS